MRTCAVCYGDVDKSEGAECDRSDEGGRHFLCAECLAHFVRTSTDGDGLRYFAQLGGCVRCPGPECMAATDVRNDPLKTVLSDLAKAEGQKDAAAVHTLERQRDELVKPHTFSDFAIARHANAAFKEYLDAKSKLIESALVKDNDQRIKEAVEEENRRLAAMSEAERQLRKHRLHIVERILNCACPSCGQAYLDFTVGECFAMKCKRPGCNRQFCGYCIGEGWGDAHDHVARCIHGEGMFPNPPALGAFERHQKVRRRRMLRAYLDAEFGNTAARDQVVVEVARELRDLGLEPEEFTCA